MAKVSCKYCGKKYHAQGIHHHLVACSRTSRDSLEQTPVDFASSLLHIVDAAWSKLTLEEKTIALILKSKQETLAQNEE